MGEGQLEHYTFIYCRSDDFGLSERASFLADAEACEHARLRLLQHGPDWVSVVVARSIHSHGASLQFLGSWDRDSDGALTWSGLTGCSRPPSRHN
jgi:hypothetical protein